jgi:hypothetical protein
VPLTNEFKDLEMTDTGHLFESATKYDDGVGGEPRYHLAATKSLKSKGMKRASKRGKGKSIGTPRKHKSNKHSKKRLMRNDQVE